MEEKEKKNSERDEKKEEERKKREAEIDQELEQTFPASDPPSFTMPGND